MLCTSSSVSQSISNRAVLDQRAFADHCLYCAISVTCLPVFQCCRMTCVHAMSCVQARQQRLSATITVWGVRVQLTWVRRLSRRARRKRTSVSCTTPTCQSRYVIHRMHALYKVCLHVALLFSTRGSVLNVCVCVCVCLQDKIEIIAKETYHAAGVSYTPEAEAQVTHRFTHPFVLSSRAHSSLVPARQCPHIHVVTGTRRARLQTHAFASDSERVDDCVHVRRSRSTLAWALTSCQSAWPRHSIRSAMTPS